MWPIIKCQINNFLFCRNAPYASIVIFLQDPGRLDKIAHFANYLTNRRKEGFADGALKSIDVYDAIALPEYFSIILHKFFLASLVGQEFIHVFLYLIIWQCDRGTKHNRFINITSQQWFQLIIK